MGNNNGSLNRFMGFAVGVGIMSIVSILGYNLGMPNVNEAKIFQRENGKPAVIRMYKPGFDGIFVERDKKYIPMKNYLETILDEADRNIEEELIKKAVEWYK